MIAMCISVLFLWDYFITFGDEIRYVWQEEHSTATWIFVANRYVNLTIALLEILEQTHQQTLLVSTFTPPLHRSRTYR